MSEQERFSQTVRELLDGKGWSVREVTRRSGNRISTTTILNMLSGHIPNSDVIIEFGEALGETPEEDAKLADQLLSLAGKRARYHSLMPSFA